MPEGCKDKALCNAIPLAAMMRTQPKRKRGSVFFIATRRQRILLAGCGHSDRDSLPVTSSSPSSSSPTAPAASAPGSEILATQDHPEVNESKTTEIPDQSFEVQWESWGKVRFVSAEQVHQDGRADLILTLTDSPNNVLYSFPQPKLTEAWHFDAVKAVSFKDLDQDGKKDVIVLAEYLTGIGSEGNIPFTAPSVFIQKEGEFVSDFDLDNSLYATGKVKTIGDVTAFFKRRADSHKPPTPTEGAAAQEEVSLQRCKRVQASNMSTSRPSQGIENEGRRDRRDGHGIDLAS